MSVQLIFSTRKGIFSKLVRFITWSHYSHVDMIVGGDHIIGASVLHGVEEVSLAYRKSVSHRWVIGEVPTIAAEDDDNIYRALKSQVGKPYDWFGILGFLFHRDWQNEDRWFCSELIAWAFDKVGTRILADSVRKSRVSPEHLLMSPMIKITEKSYE